MSKKFTIIVINFILILVLCLIAIKGIDKAKGLTDVYVAKTAISKGVKITADMIEQKKVTLNREGSSSGSNRVSYYKDVVVKKEDVIAQYAAYDMIPGEIIVKEKLSLKVTNSDQFLYNIPKGYYAYVIPSGIEGQSGIIQINDYVDLYINSKDGGITDEPSLRHLRVYDLRNGAGASVTKIQESATGDKSSDAIKYIVFALNDYQINKLSYYETKGAIIKVALRKRPSSEYEIIDNPQVTYPNFAVSDKDIIDPIKEQQLIDQNRILIDNGKAIDTTNKQ